MVCFRGRIVLGLEGRIVWRLQLVIAPRGGLRPSVLGRYSLSPPVQARNRSAELPGRRFQKRSSQSVSEACLV